MSAPTDTALNRTERYGDFVVSGAVWYLPDVQLWEPRIHIARVDGAAQDFVVPCGPECYRKSSEEAFNAGWAAARQWLDGGRIPWKAKG
ncbi:MAG TPA: hypothetical protein VF169_19420 [Albitalea sp.]|uniref:hypothetical protein n=1 Tax=Piscinibacter sp. TaxID=1903157 RepID=UPI002ED39265